MSVPTRGISDSISADSWVTPPTSSMLSPTCMIIVWGAAQVDAASVDVFEHAILPWVSCILRKSLSLTMPSWPTASLSSAVRPTTHVLLAVSGKPCAKRLFHVWLSSCLLRFVISATLPFRSITSSIKNTPSRHFPVLFGRCCCLVRFHQHPWLQRRHSQNA